MMKTIPLMLTGAGMCLLLLIGVQKPDSSHLLESKVESALSMAETVGTTAHKKSFRQTDSTENAKVFPVLKREEVKSRKNRIDEIEAGIKSSNLIDRLNGDMITDEERKDALKQFQELDQKRAEELESELSTIEGKVAKLESNLGARLRAFRVQP